MAARKDQRLDTYRNRRDFGRSPEPAGEGAWRATGNPIFVIQQHAARTTHFDLRLEIDGVLVSWAVPKGPSTDPSVRRLAIRTEDHPMEFADFEGVIAAGEYGGGRVIVWDAGPYRNLKADDDGNEIPVAKALDEGAIEVWLEGRKLRGGYALVHAKPGGDEKNWLLIKMKDDGADARRNPVSTEPGSVLSGRTLSEIDGE